MARFLAATSHGALVEVGRLPGRRRQRDARLRRCLLRAGVCSSCGADVARDGSSRTALNGNRLHWMLSYPRIVRRTDTAVSPWVVRVEKAVEFPPGAELQ